MTTANISNLPSLARNQAVTVVLMGRHDDEARIFKAWYKSSAQTELGTSIFYKPFGTYPATNSWDDGTTRIAITKGHQDIDYFGAFSDLLEQLRDVVYTAA